jgi:hypothetical protein
MAALTSAKTWTSGERPTASSMNSGIRDRINSLNNFANLITQSTAGDSGVSTRINITRPQTFDWAYTARLEDDTYPRLQIHADGEIRWGTGSADPDIYVRRESSLYVHTNGGWLAEHPGGGSTGFALRVTGDTVSRVSIGKDISNRGMISFSYDGQNANVRMLIEDNGTLLLQNPAAPSTGVQILASTSATGAAHSFGHRRISDNQPRVAIGQTSSGLGGIMFGNGSSSPTGLALAYAATGRIGLNGMLNANDGIATKVVAGAIGNGSYEAAAVDGLMAIDSANGRIYFRYGGSHHFVAQTAGIVIPENERDCPQCGNTIVIGERVVARVNEYQSDGARHGLWEHEACPA